MLRQKAAETRGAALAVQAMLRASYLILETVRSQLATLKPGDRSAFQKVHTDGVSGDVLIVRKPGAGNRAEFSKQTGKP